jgi:branched-chain amino acid aminotransferase
MGTATPYDSFDGVIWWNGSFVDWKEAKVHVLTHGLHYGSSIFEGERAYDGTIFKSRAHSERLQRSAELMGMQPPFTIDEVEAAKAETFKKMGFENAYIRAVAWRGSEMMGVSAQKNTIHLAIAMWQWGNYFADKAKGIRITISDWRRPPPDCAPVKAKAAGLYMICTLSKHAAEAQGYADALMLDYKGRVAECTGAHVFFVKDGALHTPIGECLLDGITHATVCELAEARGLKVHKRDILPGELASFAECFIVGTAAEVTPVREIKGTEFTPGEITRALSDDYDLLVRGRLKRAAAE